MSLLLHVSINLILGLTLPATTLNRLEILINKVIEKVEPTEGVGVVCKFDGKYQVVEYSEISKSTSEKKAPDGHLLFNAGNICNHFFTIDFLKYIINEKLKTLPHHVAKKKIPFIDDSGKRIQPKSPNGIKMEKFVFDVFQFSNKFAVLEIDREVEFSPLKNPSGTPKDSPDTSRRDTSNLHYRFIVDAGGKFIDSNGDLVPVTGNAPVVCEISPLLSYAGEGLEDIVGDREFSVNNGPVYLQADGEVTKEVGYTNPHEPAKKKVKGEC